MGYRLRRRASDDLARLYADGRKMFGIAKARAYHGEFRQVFALLADNPGLGVEFAEIAPPVRIHHHGSHVVVYRIDDGGDVEILRIRHAREDWFRTPV